MRVCKKYIHINGVKSWRGVEEWDGKDVLVDEEQ